MSAIKLLTSLLIISCFTAALAHTCQHDELQGKRLIHNFPSILEDMDLAFGDMLGSGGRSPQSQGRPQGGSGGFDFGDMFGGGGRSPQPQGRPQGGSGGFDFGDMFGSGGRSPQPQGGRSPQPQGGRSQGGSGGFDFGDQDFGGRSSQPARDNTPLVQADPKGSAFRIVVDYTNLRISDQSVTNYISKGLMPAVVDYFTATLRLKYPLKNKFQVPMVSNIDSFCSVPIPRIYVNPGVDADLVVLVRAVNEPQSGFIANAGSCIDDERSGRSTLAIVTFNLAKMTIDETDPLSHAENIYTTIHELCHVLGFTYEHFSKFLLPNGQPNRNAIVTANVNGNTMTMVNVEPLTSKLRKFYGCDKIQGGALENEGGSGSKNSHFERRIFFNEFMTASSIADARISEFTLALLEGSGWYVVDYSKAEPFFAGQGEGCEYYVGKCTDSRGKAAFPEFCERQGSLACSASYSGGAICGQDQFSDGCKIPHAQINYDCRNAAAKQSYQFLKEVMVFGPNTGSKCFTGNVLEMGYSIGDQKTAYCFTNKCKQNGASTTLDVIIGKTVVSCIKQGPVSVKGYSGQLDCPDPVAFCATTNPKYCPRGCMGRGTCVNDQCQCKSGFNGSDCAAYNGK